MSRDDIAELLAGERREAFEACVEQSAAGRGRGDHLETGIRIRSHNDPARKHEVDDERRDLGMRAIPRPCDGRTRLFGQQQVELFRDQHDSTLGAATRPLLTKPSNSRSG